MGELQIRAGPGQRHVPRKSVAGEEPVTTRIHRRHGSARPPTPIVPTGADQGAYAPSPLHSPAVAATSGEASPSENSRSQDEASEESSSLPEAIRPQRFRQKDWTKQRQLSLF